MVGSSCCVCNLSFPCIVLPQIKENLSDLLKPEHDDHFLLRFLRGKIESVYIIGCVCEYMAA